MFVGHLALAFAAKRKAPDMPLSWLVAAVTMAELVWPVFLLAGLEQVRISPGATAFSPLVFESYPWSHSLVMLLAWGILLTTLARWRGLSPSAGPLLVALVLSHWVLDFLSHAPDVPLWPGSSLRLGLGLWHSIPGTLLGEGALWVVGIAFFLRGRRHYGSDAWRRTLVGTQSSGRSTAGPATQSDAAGRNVGTVSENPRGDTSFRS